MAQTANFISETWLKNFTPLPSNIDVKELQPFYYPSQDKYIRDVLGDELYNRISDGITNNNLNNDETELLKLIRRTLGYYIVYEAFPFLANKIKNIGVNNTTDDKQNATDSKILKEMRQEVSNNAEYYMVRLNKYLCTNHTLFPEYVFTNDDVNPNKKAGYRCPIYIDPCHLDENFIQQYIRR